MGGTRRGARMVVPAYIVGTAVVAALSVYALRSVPSPRAATVPLSWWSLGMLFTATQASVLNVQVRREARSIFLSEIPFLLGLLYLSAPGLFAARVLGAFVASAVFRKQFRTPSKLLFNTALALAEAGIGVLVYRAVLWGGSPMTPHAWTAAVGGAVAACASSALAVSLLIRALEGMQPLRDVVRIVASAGVQAGVTATTAVLIAASLAESPWAIVPLIVLTTVLVAAYRGYARLNERHTNLELLHGFTEAVTSDTDIEDTLQGLMARVGELLHAEQVRLTLVTADRQSEDEEVVLSRGEATLSHRPSPYLGADAGWVRDQLINRGEPLLVRRADRHPAARQWLESQSVRETIVVPLRTEAGLFGLLGVDDRLGEARGFDTGDLRFLETVGNHVSVTLHNGRLLNQLRHDSLHDSLTGLPNRTFFQRELDRALRASGPGCAVGILDLDSFKDVNDTLGHQHGDELLREVARRLTDAAGESTLIARLGGDEFAVLARVCPDEDGARQLAESLVASLHEPMVITDIEVPLGASVGLSLAPAHGTTTTMLMRRADLAMYAAKDVAAGVRVFDASLDTSSDSKLAIVSRLRRAIEQGELEVYMQPKADLGTGAICSAEALVRWCDDRGNNVPPDEFIPVAERSGLIRPLTELVLRRAVAACADWQLHTPGVGVAVNLSAKSLTDTEIVRLVEQVLQTYQLTPSLLTLELTESSIMADTSRTFRLLEQLRALGIRLSIDDFGTGYSSLSYLRRLPVTEVKIDRSFVMRMAIDNEDAVIVKAIIDLARNLRLQVVAEGIEDKATWALLAEQGCDLGQGYYLARPMPSLQFGRWLDARTDSGRPAQLRVVANS